MPSTAHSGKPLGAADDLDTTDVGDREVREIVHYRTIARGRASATSLVPSGSVTPPAGVGPDAARASMKRDHCIKPAFLHTIR
jgi:hypothetical protein